MKIKSYLTLGASVLAAAAMSSVTTGASAHLVYPPFHIGTTPHAINLKDGANKIPYLAPKKIKSGKWTDVANVPFTGSQGGWGPLQLTDGRVIMKQSFTGSAAVWYSLTPDSKGKYTDGTWTQIASMPAGYSPDFYASQVMPNGNVVVNGGEYNDQCGGGCWTNKGAIYDPVANKWTTVNPPSGWNSIGDSESVVLPDGSYMLGDCCFFSDGEQVLATVSGTTVTWATPTKTWTCSGPCMDEEGFTPLEGGEVLLVDVWHFTSSSDEYWIYDDSTGTWTESGNTPDRLSDSVHYELGAAAETPQYGSSGTILQFTANTTSPGPNDIYDIATGKWKSGPTFKVGTAVYSSADAPVATLPDGNILTEMSPGFAVSPAHFWEVQFSSTGAAKIKQVDDTKTASTSTDFTGNLMLLPTGEVLWDNSQSSLEVAVYAPKGHAKAAWLPVVSSVSSTLTIGSTGNAISGTNFNGFDLGGNYGDDNQDSTNFPLVRITNTSTGDVCFGRSYNFSTMGVWTTGTTNATFDIPSTCESGASKLQVIVNGIASTGTSVTLKS